MNVRTKIKSGQSAAASNNVTINQAIDVATGANGLHVVTALNTGVAAPTSVAIGGVSVDVSLDIKA